MEKWRYILPLLETMKSIEYTIRDYNPKTDEAFVVDTWIRQIRSLPIFRLMDDSKFRLAKRIVHTLIAKYPPKVACAPDFEYQIRGWCCGRADTKRPVVHFTYVKLPWRGNGIAFDLVQSVIGELHESTPLYFTFKTKAIADMASKKKWLVYNPFYVKDDIIDDEEEN
jgi:predicted GNAT family acetyltransferase